MASGQVQRAPLCAFGFGAVFTPGNGSVYWMDGPQGLQGTVSFMHIKFKFSCKAACLPTSQVSCLCPVFLAKSNKKRCKKRANLHQEFLQSWEYLQSFQLAVELTRVFLHLQMFKATYHLSGSEFYSALCPREAWL